MQYGSPTFQLISAAFFGLAFAYWSAGLVYMLVFLLAYETLVLVTDQPVDIVQRMSVVAVSILAWVLGRYLVWYERPEDDRQTKPHKARTGLLERKEVSRVV